MPHARMLITAAKQAHERGDIGEAAILYRTILELYPTSKEAVDAAYYLAHAKPRPSVPVAAGRPVEEQERDSENVSAEGGDVPAY